MLEMPSVEELIQSLRDPEASVRKDASRRLRDLPKEDVPAPMLEAAFDDDFSVRLAVVEALSSYPDDNVIEILKKALFDEEWEVQWAAMRSLGSIWKEADLRKMGDKLPEKRIAGLEAIAKKPKDICLVPAIASLDDEQEEVCAAAIRTLAAFRDPAAIVPLRKLLDDVGQELQALIAETLSLLGDPEINEIGRDYLMACDQCGHKLPPSFLFKISQWDQPSTHLCQFHYDEFCEANKPFIGKLKACKLCKEHWPKVELVEGACPNCRATRYESMTPSSDDQFRCFHTHKLRPRRDLSPASPPNQPLSSKAAYQISQQSVKAPFLTDKAVQFLEHAYDQGLLLCEECRTFVPMEEIAKGQDFRDQCVCRNCHK